MSGLSHFDEAGRAVMVDVTAKVDSDRLAVASAVVAMQPETLRTILDGQMTKGDVLAVAELAGIMAAKKTADLIPLCHPLALSSAKVALRPEPADGTITILATVRTRGPTGVEMEALTAASVAALTVYDMCKAIDRSIEVRSVRLEQKSGGRSGDWHRQP